MIRLCTGFPPGWPHRERVLAAIATHWPSIDLAADELGADRALDHYQLVAPAAAADDMADGDLLGWLDPDIEVNSAVPSYVVPHLIKDADLAFIGREDGETDLGFWVVRLSRPVRAFLVQLGDAARPEVPAGEAWAQVRAAASLIERDLTPGKAGATWANGPLGRYSQRLPRPS